MVCHGEIQSVSCLSDSALVVLFLDRSMAFFPRAEADLAAVCLALHEEVKKWY